MQSDESNWKARQYADSVPSLNTPLSPSISCWAAMRVGLTLSIFAAASTVALAGRPEDAERFTRFAGFKLADTPSFEDIAKKFGPAPIRHSGDAADSDSRVCYRTADRRGVLEFSRGEVDWGYVFRQARQSDDACPETKAIGVNQFKVAGVMLGMSRERYEQIVGSPKEAAGDRVLHEFQYVHVDKDSEHWDVVISLTALFSSGKLTSFTVDRVETD